MQWEGKIIQLYRNFHFIYADQEIVDIKIPLNKGG